jgi:hypothetical protein
MNTSLAYKSCFIHIESFQLTYSSGWIPRFKLTRQDTQSGWGDAPSYRDRLDKVFLSKDEADEFALEDAMQWIDQNGRTVGRR